MILDYSKTFIAKLNDVSYSRNPYETFNDFIYMAASALYSWKKDEQVEKEYSDVAKNYSVDELSKMSELLFILTEALEQLQDIEENGDFLGRIFMSLDYGDKRNGQFFTPYNVSYMMAQMMIGEKEFPQNRICKISDPCCGAGGMLIASAMVMMRRGLNYQRDAYFVGQDIDARCVRMAFIQLSLLGVPAILICGDTLAMKCYWQRETIGYYFADIPQRIRMEALIDIICILESPRPEKRLLETEPIDVKMPSLEERKKYLQGELF
jgi:type I restriction-modification system DNA methylase subunit